MIFLSFVKHIEYEEYLKLKMQAKRHIIHDRIEIFDIPPDLWLINYEGADIYAVYKLGESSGRSRLGDIDRLMSARRNTQRNFGPRLATSSEVLKTDLFRLALLQAGIIPKGFDDYDPTEAAIFASRQLCECIKARWYRALTEKE